MPMPKEYRDLIASIRLARAAMLRRVAPSYAGKVIESINARADGAAVSNAAIMLRGYQQFMATAPHYYADGDPDKLTRSAKRYAALVGLATQSVEDPAQLTYPQKLRLLTQEEMDQFNLNSPTYYMVEKRKRASVGKAIAHLLEYAKRDGVTPWVFEGLGLGEAALERLVNALSTGFAHVFDDIRMEEELINGDFTITLGRNFKDVYTEAANKSGIMSCMVGKNIDTFYRAAGAQMLTLRNKNNEIVARAVAWPSSASIAPDVPPGVLLIGRIYRSGRYGNMSKPQIVADTIARCVRMASMQPIFTYGEIPIQPHEEEYIRKYAVFEAIVPKGTEVPAIENRAQSLLAARRIGRFVHVIFGWVRRDNFGFGYQTVELAIHVVRDYCVTYRDRLGLHLHVDDRPWLEEYWRAPFVEADVVAAATKAAEEGEMTRMTPTLQPKE